MLTLTDNDLFEFVLIWGEEERKVVLCLFGEKSWAGSEPFLAYYSLQADGNFAWVGAASSTFTLVAIAIERYFVVVFPHGNKGKRTIRKLKVCVSWLRRLMLLINCYCIVIALIALLLINPLNPKSTKFNN